MARQKISEFKAKSLLFKSIGLTYSGISLTLDTAVEKIGPLSDDTFVVKVDQGVKGRYKKGLVMLGVAKGEIPAKVEEVSQKRFNSFLVEKYVPHESKQEKYLSLSRVREGILTLYSSKGGVDIEKDPGSVEQQVIQSTSEGNLAGIAQALDMNLKFLIKIFEAFDAYFFSFLEINPLIAEGTEISILDLAVEVDSAAEFFVKGAWSSDDFIEANSTTFEEENVRKLKEKSQASFKLNVLNPDGAVFVLLSGGGASLVVADEVYNLGFGKNLANYGEYSGNPNEEETYIYTKNLLSLLLKSKSKKKVLIIGGGVANFTDVRITFRGIIQAVGEVKNELLKDNVKIFVRRGGPNQEEGLAVMKAFLQKENLYGDVKGPEMVLTDIVKEAVQSL